LITHVCPFKKNKDEDKENKDEYVIGVANSRLQNILSKEKNFIFIDDNGSARSELKNDCAVGKVLKEFEENKHTNISDIRSSKFDLGELKDCDGIVCLTKAFESSYTELNETFKIAGELEKEIFAVIIY